MSVLWVPGSATLPSTVISARPKEAVRKVLTTGTKLTARRRTRKDPRTAEPCRQASEPPLHCGGPGFEKPSSAPCPRPAPLARCRGMGGGEVHPSPLLPKPSLPPTFLLPPPLVALNPPIPLGLKQTMSAPGTPVWGGLFL